MLVVCGGYVVVVGFRCFVRLFWCLFGFVIVVGGVVGVCWFECVGWFELCACLGAVLRVAYAVLVGFGFGLW